MARSSSVVPVTLIVRDGGGVAAVEGKRDSALGGVLHRGVLWPDELLEHIGLDVYVMADRVEMPRSGDMNTPGDAIVAGHAVELVEVSQLQWAAKWEAFYSGLRRLTMSALWDKGAGVGNTFRNLGTAVTVILLLVLTIVSFNLRGTVGAVVAQQELTNGSIVRLIPTPVPVPTVGRPGGDPGSRP